MKILGLDLGTNSIGWALVHQDFDQKNGKILGLGSRIIPMSQDILGDFGKGSSVSQTAERTGYRSTRRLRERYLLRRERLHRILNQLGFLPEHYVNQIDFEKRFGQFMAETEPKLAYNNGTFIFRHSFEEMLDDFRASQPELVIRKNRNGEPAKIPYDWTIYYLRKKALSQKIEKGELAWLLLNFNQKRGYYQLRGEDEETTTDKKEYVLSLKVVRVEKGEADKKNDKKTWYNITLENGLIYSAPFTSEPLWSNTEKEFLITEELDELGNIKIVKDKKTDTTGREKRKITPLPSFEEIDLMSKKDQDKIYKKIKVKTEITIENSGKTVGVYIYDTLLKKTEQKIRGKLVRTIERRFYKEELRLILQKQQAFHPELQNEDLYNDCIRELYRSNEAHQLSLSKRDFVHLFLDDIIFYQRPLKSQKSSIGNCSLEYRKYKVNDEEKTEYLKAVPKSHPLYQEFRLWQWIYNLNIYKREDDTSVTHEFLNSTKSYEKLFEFLNNRKEIEQKPLIRYLLEQIGLKGKALTTETGKYRWNFVEDKKYPCNETRTLMMTRLAKVGNVPDSFLTSEREEKLWHIIYSVTDPTDYGKALKTYAEKHGLDSDSFIENFKRFPPFKSEYGSYSAKAIRKLLPLIRVGKYWDWNQIDDKTLSRISRIITGEYDEEIKSRVREKAIHLKEENHFQGLQLWLASYIVYGRHSEAALAGKWKSVSDMENYLKEFKQHSLRNPIVEQVVIETLRVVKDIWQQYGHSAKDFFDEIHIELGREMKHTAEDRKRMTDKVTENENANLRIKAMLVELKNDTSVENVRPYSPIQQEILKIYEDGILNSDIEIDEDILKISKTPQPTNSELKRYILWLQQKYRSPYTGEMIPLGKLFTPEYEIEHVIPQSRYFDDSFSNKVICESAVNSLKDNQLGLEFIKNHHGEIVQIGSKVVKIFTEDEYKDFVNKHYEKNRSKRNKLLLEDIPEKMIERQLNDTRYISKYITSLLSNIVRSDTADDGINSKNVIPGNGKITSVLKQDWGLNDVWNELILSRFERLNKLTNTSVFTAYNEKHQKYLPTVPLELSKNFQKKRIDHRHHALDALVIACATRNHVNLLNNKHAKSPERFDLNRKLRKFERVVYSHPKTGERIEKEVPKDFLKPWDTFTVDARNALEAVVVSFKQNLRVINKATNHYEKWVEKDGQKSKDTSVQKGVNWAIRKPMHKATVSGKVELNRIKVPKGKILTATRKSLNTTFDLKTIESITDTGIQKILKNYLLSRGGNAEIAFSPEGIDDMNRNISKYNDGKLHQAIYKVRVFELGSKFPLGQSGNKKTKYVEAKDGTNLYFGVYADKNGKRFFETIPLNIVIERQKQGLTSIPEKKVVEENNTKTELNLIFGLSPNDLVYVPTKDELENLSSIDFNNLTKEQRKSLYNVNDFSSTCYFRPNRIAKAIAPKEVDMNYNEQKGKTTGSYDMKTASVNGLQIKDICIKLNLDRLGNLSKAK